MRSRARLAPLAPRLALAALLVLPAVAGATGGRDHDAGPADSARVDPLRGYLDSLSRFGERRFSETSLGGSSLPDSVVDSLAHRYDSTGEAPVPARSGDRRLRVAPGLAGLRYNRVEGLGARASLVVRPPGRPRLDVGGWIGYETAPEEVDWEAGIRTGRIAPLGGLRLRALHTRQVVAYGSGGIVGNSLTSLIAGDDFDDYHRRKGWEFGLDRPFRRMMLDLSYRIEDQESIAAAADWSLFGGKNAFRPNPAIDDGEARILRLSVRRRAAAGGAPSVRWEGSIAGSGLGGDLDYRSSRAEGVGALRPWRGDRAIVRLAGGVAEGDTVPRQAAHLLGGFATLRGYGVNEIAARRFLHLGIDYEIGTDLLRPLPLLRRLGVQFVPFFDGAAILALQGPDGGLVRPDDPLFRFAAGLGIQRNLLGIPGGVGQLRFDLGRRLDRADDAWTYRFRITAEAPS